MGSLHCEIVAEHIMHNVGRDITRFGTVVGNQYTSLGNLSQPLWTVNVQIAPVTLLSLGLYDLDWQDWVVHIGLHMGREHVPLKVIKFEEDTKGFCPKCRSKDCDEVTCPIDAPIVKLMFSKPELMSQEIVRIFRKIYRDYGCSRY